MYKAVQSCTHCNANLTLDDLRGTECPYCQTVYPRHAYRAQHEKMVNEVVGLQAGLENQRGYAQAAIRAQMGIQPVQPPGAPPPGTGPGFPPGPGPGFPPAGGPLQMPNPGLPPLPPVVATQLRRGMIVGVVSAVLLALGIAGFVAFALIARG